MGPNLMSKGIAFILTVAISVLFVILVAAFYHSVVGRQVFTYKRSAKTVASYKVEAGRQDAIARLRIGRLDPFAPEALDPDDYHEYCLDIDVNPPATCIGCILCPDPWDVKIIVQPRNADDLNKITATATY